MQSDGRAKLLIQCDCVGLVLTREIDGRCLIFHIPFDAVHLLATYSGAILLRACKSPRLGGGADIEED